MELMYNQNTKKSSGTAKAALATGITGSALGLVNWLGGSLPFLGQPAGRAVAPTCSEDHYVTRYDAEKDAKIATLESQIALRDANTFTDSKILELYRYVDGRFGQIEKELGAQAVVNQSVRDSFSMVNERLGCVKESLEEQIRCETRERKCGDQIIVTYSNGTFYPKQIAGVETTKDSTPAQTYDPLPVECCK